MLLCVVAVAFVALSVAFWTVMSFLIAAFFIAIGLAFVLLAAAFGGYVVWRRSRL